jgi:hypothetical protein
MSRTTKATTKTAKAQKATKAPPPPTEKKDNRYLRAARIIIEAGDGVELAELALRAEMSTATASHCLEAFRGVTTALREAKLMPAKPKPAAPKVAEEVVPA